MLSEPTMGAPKGNLSSGAAFSRRAGGTTACPGRPQYGHVRATARGAHRTAKIRGSCPTLPAKTLARCRARSMDRTRRSRTGTIAQHPEAGQNAGDESGSGFGCESGSNGLDRGGV